jgi:uncharacterized membrane protein
MNGKEGGPHEDPDKGVQPGLRSLRSDSAGKPTPRGETKQDEAHDGNHQGELDYAKDLEPRDASEERILTDEIYAIAQYSKFWSGALPPPDEFNQYQPDAQQAILRWNDEAQARENRSAEDDSEIIRANIKLQSRSLLLSFLLVIITLIGAIILLLLDKKIEGFVLLVPSVIAAFNGSVKAIKTHREKVTSNKEKADKCPSKT